MRNRWRIQGRFRTREPLHVGSGEFEESPRIRDQDGKPCDVSAIVRDVDGLPCIPGTTIKGVLRSWAERFYPNESRAVEMIFGTRDSGAPDASAGWAEFLTARLIRPDTSTMDAFARHVPYWCAERLCGIMSHVCIDRQTGAARAGKLYYEEFVPEGLEFQAEIDATRLESDHVDLLVAIIEQGAIHPTYAYGFGANGSDGWGRVEWSGTKVTACSHVPTAFQGVGFDCCTDPYVVQPVSHPSANPAHAVFDLTLAFDGPLLVNDASRAKEKGDAEGTNFVPLRRAGGSPWLPASSLRGALRQRAEFLFRSLDPARDVEPREPAAEAPIVRVFGATSGASRMQILDLKATVDRGPGTQEFVAIDRFRGGAADGAKFKAEYLDRPEFSTRIVLDLDGLQGDDFALFLRALKDLCAGGVCLGWGASKGYGEARGTRLACRLVGVRPHWFPEDIDAKAVEIEKLSDWFRAILVAAPIPMPQQTATAAQSQTIQGRIIRRPTRRDTQTLLSYQARRGETSLPIVESTLPASLRNNPADEIPVDFEWRATNQPHQIRPRGEKIVLQTPALSVNPTGRFANPYYFLPMENRTTFQGDLADAPPAGHHRYLPGRLSARIRVMLTAKTPLLICDEGEATSVRDHRSYGVRLQDGTPLLASSSVRGMLRSVYEAVTNSRFGVFPNRTDLATGLRRKNARPPGIRLPAESGLELVPVRVVQPTAGALELEVLPGTSRVNPEGNRDGSQPMYAAWCAHYGRPGPPGTTWTPTGLNQFHHGSEAWAFLTRWHYRKTLPGGTVVEFDFWNVEELAPPSSVVPGHVPTARRPAFGHATPLGAPALGWRKGYLSVSHQNMTGKHDERFFFSDPPPGVPRVEPIELTDKLARAWRELIQDYHDQHEREINRGDAAPPGMRRPLVFSRHISLPGSGEPAVAELDLKAGDLRYARLRQDSGTWSVEALYPVMIARQLSKSSANDLLPERLRPATNINALSPADRVFGWVSQSEPSEKPGADHDVASRSHVRIGPVRCVTDFQSAVTEFDPPKILAILAEPKPQQGRFYLGKADGTAQPDTPPKRTKVESGYKPGNRVRGPKVYPHHARGIQDGIAFSRSPSDQNRSIKSWVNPGTAFEFDLHATNLSRWELGGLLWLLSLPEDHHLRLGLGKPLGFGSVRAEIITEKSVIAENALWIRSLPTGEPAESMAYHEIANEFERSMTAAAPRLLPAFLRCAAGLGEIPIHYPHRRRQAEPEKHYEWFVANERAANRFSLPDLGSSNPTLPLLD